MKLKNKIYIISTSIIIILSLIAIIGTWITISKIIKETSNKIEVYTNNIAQNQLHNSKNTYKSILEIQPNQDLMAFDDITYTSILENNTFYLPNSIEKDIYNLLNSSITNQNTTVKVQNITKPYLDKNILDIYYSIFLTDEDYSIYPINLLSNRIARIFFENGNYTIIQDTILTGKPNFLAVNSSSCIDKNDNDTYSPNRAVDNNPDTAWVSKTGINEWIELISTKEQVCRGIILNLGYNTNENIWYNNSRVKKFDIYIDGELYKENIEFEDNFYNKDYNIIIPFDTAIKAKNIRIVIKQVYTGNTHKRTAISSFKIF